MASEPVPGVPSGRHRSRAGALRPREGGSGRATLMTVLGEFVLTRGERAWTATLIDILDAVGVAEKNARQAIARLGEQGFIVSERVGRRVRWHLTASGHELLTAGTGRIYGFLGRTSAWDGRWLIVIFSVPEEQRSKRHHLRQRLGFAGFGFPAAGVAVSTHLDREALALQALGDLGIDDGALLFRGDPGALAGDAELVRRAWDLDTLSARYAEFIARFARRRPADDRAACRHLTELVHEWRRFPFVDPELPPGLLPPRWPGQRAKQLFDERHAAWTPAARRWIDALERRGDAG